MDQELEQKNITISGIEDTGWGIKLKDEKGLNYNVSKFLKGTQNETKAFQVLKVLPGYGMGMVKSVKFATVPNSQGGLSRYVRIIGEPQETAGNATPGVKMPYKPVLSDKVAYVGAGQSNQSEEIRANVALKMVSEILSAGVVPITEWRKWADEFYNFKPNSTQELDKFKASLHEAGIKTNENLGFDPQTAFPNE
jgi:hypothetical protein